MKHIFQKIKHKKALFSNFQKKKHDRENKAHVLYKALGYDHCNLSLK